MWNPDHYRVDRPGFLGSSKVNELKGSVDQLTKQVILRQEKVEALSQAINTPQQ